ncbi:MAG: TetR/AcrR family transcriptional regulator [Anaerolineales bacterium]|nr:TetR/AcrR family transcriptional regulator [Anaerolineales bacterium]
MSPRPNVSAERKPQILQAAAQVFLNKGFAAARMEDIARQAELSVGNLYRYFPGKLDITLALMELFLEPSLSVSNDLLTATGTCRERLEESFLRVLEKQDPAMLTLYGEMYHLARYEPRVHAVLQDYNLRYQKIVAAILQQGLARGELRPADPDALAFAFQSIFDGFMQNMALTPEPLDLPAVLRQTFNMLFDGLSITRSSAA